MGASFEIPENVIRNLSKLLQVTDLAEIEISMSGMTVRVRAKEGRAIAFSSGQEILSTHGSTQKIVGSELHIIRSPFVGMFYRASSPKNPPFVESNQQVSKGQVLCIVEAMKVMNEIQSDTLGIVEKVFVENGSPVEFNTPLFGIRQ